MAHSPGFLKVVNEARQQITELTTKDVENKFERGDNFVFIDCREDEEFKAGRAKGAIHIGKGVIERDIELKVPDKGADIVIYCGGGFRSAIAALALKEMGYTDAKSMDGGIRAWRAAELPEEK